MPVTVRAAGVSRVTGVAIDGPQANDFAVRDDGCSGTSLAAGATCRVSVAWSPRAAGTRIATLHVALASGQVLDVPLQGFMYSGTTRYQFSGGPAGSGTESYTPGTAQLDISGADTVVRLEVRDIDNGTTFWDATFSPRPGDTLRPGSYDNAARYPFNGSQPGMDVNGHGSGCNTVSGHFTVREATYNRYDEVQSFAVDFVQYCDGDPSNEWRGSLDYRSGDTAARPPWITGAAAPGAPGGGGATPTRPAASGTGAAASTPSSTAQRATRTLRAALARRLRAALRARRRLTLTLPAGRLRLTWRAHQHVLARGRRTWRRAGRRTVVAHLTALGRRELRRHPHRPIIVTASLRLASGGRPIVVSVVSRR